MSDYDDAMVEAVDALYETAGLSATYADKLGNLPAGATSPCTVLVERSLGRYGDDVGVIGKNAVIRVRTSDVPTLPQDRDTFTVDGHEWTVVDVVFSNAYETGALVA